VLGGRTIEAQVVPSRGCVALADSARATARAAHIDLLGACPIAGAPALAELWEHGRAVTADAQEARRRASARIRDARVYAAVQTVATDATRDTEERLAALQVLAAYFHPQWSPPRSYLTGAQVGDPVPRMVDDADLPTVAEPLPANHRAAIARTFTTLAASDHDPIVRGAALRLRQAVAFSAPADLPLADGVVRLEARCGPRVLLIVSSDVDLPVVLAVEGSAFRHEYAVRRSAPGHTASLLLALPSGPVVATIGGREVARLTARHAPCGPHDTRS